MILDAGPLISAERNRRTMAALVAAALEHGEVLRTTEAVVAQVWRGPRQANLAAALKAVDVTDRFGDGRRIGELIAQVGTADPIDAHLVILARSTNEAVLSADVPDLSRLAEAAGVRLVRWSAS